MKGRFQDSEGNLPARILVMRWIAHIWSLAILMIARANIFSPDPHSTGDPLPVTDFILLGLWGIVVLGLMVGWLWERAGAMIAIGALVLRDILYISLNGKWGTSFLLVWAAFLPPVILYLLAWRMERKFQAAGK